MTAPNPVACIEVDRVIKGSNATLSGCGLGIGNARKVALSGLTLTDSLGIGVFARRLSLTDSVVTGSQPPDGPDLVSARRPQLTNTTCGTSARFANGQVTGTWGVCAND